MAEVCGYIFHFDNMVSHIRSVGQHAFLSENTESANKVTGTKCIYLDNPSVLRNNHNHSSGLACALNLYNYAEFKTDTM